MSYTMTFDVSHKVKIGGGHVKSLLRHIARDADQAAGFHFQHANKNIVPERTELNFTRVNDGSGGFRALKSVDGRPPSQELEDYLNQRLATVAKNLRTNAVPIRGIILQLDPKWFEEHNSTWRESGINQEAVDNLNASMEWACREFSQANILGFSLHLDEYSPQLQVLMTPVTEDGRLSQRDFFKGPSDLRRQHKELRAHMEKAGYDVEVRVTERSTEHLSSSDFHAKAARLQAAAQDVEDEKATYETLVRSLDARRSNLDAQQAALAKKELEVAAEREEARKTAEAAESARQAAAAARFAAKLARDEAESERARLRATNDRLQQLPPDFDRWLDKVRVGGPPLRDRFMADMAKARAARHDVTRLVNGSVRPTSAGDAEREGG
jgi:hypothetical protein